MTGPDGWAHTEMQDVPSEDQQTLWFVFIFSLKVTKHWNALPRKVAEPPFLVLFNTCHNNVLDNWYLVALLVQCGWTK